jgi:hypothetical protein
MLDAVVFVKLIVHSNNVQIELVYSSDVVAYLVFQRLGSNNKFSRKKD